jgi:hypothetical protein
MAFPFALRHGNNDSVLAPVQVRRKAIGEENELPFLRQLVIVCDPQASFGSVHHGNIRSASFEESFNRHCPARFL